MGGGRGGALDGTIYLLRAGGIEEDGKGEKVWWMATVTEVVCKSKTGPLTIRFEPFFFSCLPLPLLLLASFLFPSGSACCASYHVSFSRLAAVREKIESQRHGPVQL